MTCSLKYFKLSKSKSWPALSSKPTSTAFFAASANSKTAAALSFKKSIA